MTEPVDIHLPDGGFARTAAERAVRDAGLLRSLEDMARGPFGLTSTATAVLEELTIAADLGMMAVETLEGAILAELREPGSFEVPQLASEHRRLLAAFQVVVTADDGIRRIATRCPTPMVEGALELDGIDDLLGEAEPATLALRVMRLLRGYLEQNQHKYDPKAGEIDTFAGTTLAAALHLLRAAALTFAKTGELRPLVDALAGRSVRVAGTPYKGLSQEAATDTPAGLLDIWPKDIVGNQEYIDAGMRLARDVAAYDFAAGRNPKRINPVLFGLGSPGCGKTVTAHAIGNYFLDYCRTRHVPARFLVVRRSDWASSYQNASAANLIRIFREEVYGFHGVCGVYWPDIDTALASRASTDLRMEEKQNLGAVFGVFDGTLLPKDGRWFLICDANTMHMDEAAVSRIAQNPFTVHGPQTPEDYVELMRDLKLHDLAAFLPTDEAAWLRIGQRAIDHELSGRAIEAVANNVRGHIQDFDYPDNYFSASTEERERILGELSRPVDEAFITGAMDDWMRFQDDAAKREEEDRFDAEVDAVVRQLNASRAAVARAAALEET